MAEGLNRVTALGNTTADAELRFTQSGTAVCSFRLAIGEKFKDRDGEWQERTEFVNCVLWGKRGEAVAKFLTKGSRVCIEGRLQTRSWEAKEGGKRYTTEVVATNLILLSGRKGGGSAGDDAPPHSDDDAGGGFGDEDIPFSRFQDGFWA